MSFHQYRRMNAAKAAEKLRRKYISIEIANEIKEKKKLRKEKLL